MAQKKMSMTRREILQQKAQIPPNIRPYLEVILVRSGETFGDSEKEDIILALFLIFDKFLGEIMRANLRDAKEIEQFTAIAQRGRQAEVTAFLQRHVPDWQQITINSFEEFVDGAYRNYEFRNYGIVKVPQKE